MTTVVGETDRSINTIKYRIYILSDFMDFNWFMQIGMCIIGFLKLNLTPLKNFVYSDPYFIVVNGDHDMWKSVK